MTVECQHLHRETPSASCYSSESSSGMANVPDLDILTAQQSKKGKICGSIMPGEDSDITFESLRSGTQPTSRWWVATSIPFAGTGSWDRSTAIWLSWNYIMVLLLLYDATHLKFIQVLYMFLFKSEVFFTYIYDKMPGMDLPNISLILRFFPYKLLEKNSGVRF